MGTTRELHAFLALEPTVLPSLSVDRGFWAGLVKVAARIPLSGSVALSYRKLGSITRRGRFKPAPAYQVTGSDKKLILYVPVVVVNLV